MKAKLIRIKDIETGKVLNHLQGCHPEYTECGIAFVDPEDGDFEVLNGIDGALGNVTCSECLRQAMYIRSIDLANTNTKQLWKQRRLCKTCYNWNTQEDVGFDDIPQCSEPDSECRDYLNGFLKNCPKYLNL